jgi:hypothetical protein
MLNGSTVFDGVKAQDGDGISTFAINTLS